MMIIDSEDSFDQYLPQGSSTSNEELSPEIKKPAEKTRKKKRTKTEGPTKPMQTRSRARRIDSDSDDDDVQIEY